MIRAYLDNNATTRLSPAARAAMEPFFSGDFINPDAPAALAAGAYDPVVRAQRALGRLLGSVDLAECFRLTSGASEANSWAFWSAIQGQAAPHIITTRIEHSSILTAAAAVQCRGASVDLLECDPSGVILPQMLQASLRPDTRLVSIMLANNETGAIQPVAELGAALREVAPHALFHVDATQAVGRIAVDLAGALAEIDLLSLSAHKFHGPAGVGALFARPEIALAPLIHGRQDQGRRGGTVNGPGAAGLAAAAEEATLIDPGRQAALRDRFETLILSCRPDGWVNSQATDRLPNTSSITLPNFDAAEAVDRLALQGIWVATGSACEAGSSAPSHVLTALGLAHDEARATLRISLSRDTTQDEVDLAAEAILADAALAKR
jgi:cysteine desulfurase